MTSDSQSQKTRQEQHDIAQALATCLSSVNYQYKDENDAKAVDLLGWQKGMEINDGFAVGGKHYQAVAELCGEETAAIARRLWERRSGYPYTYMRMLPFRTVNNALVPAIVHAKAALSYVDGVMKGFSVDSYLDNCLKNVQTPNAARIGVEENYVGQVFGLLLDEDPNADMLFERIADVIAGVEEKNAVLRLLSGLLHCRRADAHAVIEALLKDSKTQENVRRTILSLAGHGSDEGFRCALKTLFDNDLPGGPSDVAAFNNWTGLAFANEQIGYDETGRRNSLALLD